jgi:ABC-type amino acid transport substrate-binding protein
MSYPVSRRAFGIVAFLLCAGLMSASHSALAQESALDRATKSKTLRLGWGPWFPYAFRDPKTNEPSGIIIDLAKSLEDAMGVKITLVETSWGELIPGLLADKYDIVMPMYATPKRALTVGFTEPLTYHGSGFLVRKVDAARFADLEAFDKSDVKISVEAASASDAWLTANLKNAELVRVKDANTGILDLVSGRVQAVGHNLEHLKRVTAEYPDTTIVPYVFGKTAAGMITRQDDQRMLNWLNVYITDIKSKGTLAGLLKKYGLDETFVAP